MQQSSPNYSYNDITMALSPITRQLERLEERTRDIATRNDLESLRKELVTRDAFEPQLNALKVQIARVEEDRETDKKATEKRFDKVEVDQLSRQDRLWIRLLQGVGILGFILALFDFLSHLRVNP